MVSGFVLEFSFLFDLFEGFVCFGLWLCLFGFFVAEGGEEG